MVSTGSADPKTVTSSENMDFEICFVIVGEDFLVEGHFTRFWASFLPSLKLNEQGNKQMTWLNPLDEAHFAVSTIQASSRSKVNLIRNTRDSHKISG